MPKTRSAQWLPGFIGSGIAWGSSFLFIKWGLVSLTSIGVAFLRVAIGAGTLLIYCLVTRTKLPSKLAEWGHIAVVGLLLNAIPSYLFAVGETHVTSVMAGLLNATTPLMTVLVISIGFREQKINVNQGIGVLIGFLGIILVTGALSGLTANSWRGVIELLCATFCYGISFPYSRRYVNVLNYPSRTLATAQILCGAIFLAPFACISGVTRAPWNAKSIVGMLILGAIGTGFAFVWNSRSVRLAGSLIASTVTYITPIVATILGIWLLKESFKFTQVIGGICVLTSGALVQKRIKLLRIS